MNFQLRYAASRRTARSSRGATRSHRRSMSRSNRRTTSTSSRNGRARATTRTNGSANAETSRLIDSGQVGRRNARRLRGLTTTRQRDRLRPPHLRQQIARARRTGRRPGRRPTAGPRRAGGLRPDPAVAARRRPVGRRPRAFRVEAADADPHGHQRTGGNRPSGLREQSGTAVRPWRWRDCAVPSPNGGARVGRLCAERAAIQLLNAPPIVGTITIDICHGRLTRDAPVHHGRRKLPLNPSSCQPGGRGWPRPPAPAPPESSRRWR